MKRYVLQQCNRYIYFIGGAAIVPSIYLTTGLLFLPMAGYSVGYALMVLFDRFSK
jgi:hypothetical protein